MNPVTGLALGRIGVGVASIVKPDLVQTSMGLTSSSPVLTQWFGNREIALGVATLLARGGSRRTLVLIGMAVDASDAATAYQAVESETIPRTPGLAGVAIAVTAVLGGLLGLRVKAKTPTKKQAKKLAKHQAKQ